MSRAVNNPVGIPSGVEVTLKDRYITVKGRNGDLTQGIHELVKVERDSDVLKVSMRVESKVSKALAGTYRALIQNMVTGVSRGFERRLLINGVGYRAQVQNNVLNLTVGYSHPINFAVPEGITIETPSQTEVVIKGNDKQKVGQVAAEIRAYRKPEPYKGKGIRYADEVIVRKEAKKT